MDPARRSLIRTTYDALAIEYAAHLADEITGKPFDRQLLDRFAEEARGAGPILELGCGPGDVTRYLYDRGVDIQGIDLSPAMVEQARRLHPGMQFREGDTLTLDVPGGTLASVVSFYAIVHLSRQGLTGAFHEMGRVLRPGGVALVAFHFGDETVRPGELWGVSVTLDWIFHRTADVLGALREAGMVVGDVLEREPYEGVEHQSKRAYVFARRGGSRLPDYDSS